MKEPELKEIKGTSILTKGFFNRLIKRIECTKPLAGTGIAIKEEENGTEISLVGEYLRLNVCSNGTPTAISVFGLLITD